MLNAKQIKELREELLLKQDEFGALFGVSRVTVCNWEKGNETISVYIWVL